MSCVENPTARPGKWAKTKSPHGIEANHTAPYRAAQEKGEEIILWWKAPEAGEFESEYRNRTHHPRLSEPNFYVQKYQNTFQL